MTAVEGRPSLWEALAGRAPLAAPGAAPGTTSGDADVWQSVVERLNPAKARPQLRDGVEAVAQTSVRGERYVMLRSPDQEGRYVRLRPDEWELARRMDGATTVAALVGQFVRISGRLAPDQVRRVVADLASHRMLAELPVDAFHGLVALHHPSGPRRLAHRALDAVRGRRMVLADPDRFVTGLYRGVGRHLFTVAGAIGLGLVTLTGLVLFATRWAGGARQVFVANESYLGGAITLVLLNAVCLALHEVGHALGVKHAGRRAPAAGVLLYYGIPSVFVDTTDVWMANRRQRLITSAAGPAASVSLAGLVLIVGEVWPGFAPLAFKLAFAWYLNTLFNLNPLLALDGYYLLMDWVEVPNLRGRGLPMFVRRARAGRPHWRGLAGEDRILVMYGAAAAVWLLLTPALLIQVWKDRLTGVALALWYHSWWTRVGFVVLVAALIAPLIHAALTWLVDRIEEWWQRRAERRRESDLPRRLDALRFSALGTLPVAVLGTLAERARWMHPRPGRLVIAAGTAPVAGYVVVSGSMHGRRPGDPTGAVRAVAGPGETVGLVPAWRRTPASESWEATGNCTVLALDAVLLATALGTTALPEAVVNSGKVEIDLPPSRYGVHEAASSPAIGSPPGPVPVLPGAEETDRRLARRFAWLLLLLLLLGFGWLGFGVATARRSWVEIPSHAAVLSVPEGHVDAVLDGERVRLRRGDERLVRVGDVVLVAEESRGRLTYRGGAHVDLCPETDATVEAIDARGRRTLTPSSVLHLEAGRAIADTAPRAFDFRALELVVRADERVVTNAGDARYSVDTVRARATVAEGIVRRDGTLVAPLPPPVELGCEPSVGGSDGAGGGATTVPPATTTPPPTVVATTVAPTVPKTVPVTATVPTTTTTVPVTVPPPPTVPVGTPPKTDPPGTSPGPTSPTGTEPPNTTPPHTTAPPPTDPTETTPPPPTNPPPPTDPPPPTNPPPDGCPPPEPGVPPPPGCP